MDIRLVIRMTPIYTNEYLIRHLPDPVMHPMNIQSVIRLTPVYTNEYSVGHPPDTNIHQ